MTSDRALYTGYTTTKLATHCKTRRWCGEAPVHAGAHSQERTPCTQWPTLLNSEVNATFRAGIVAFDVVSLSPKSSAVLRPPNWEWEPRRRTASTPERKLPPQIISRGPEASSLAMAAEASAVHSDAAVSHRAERHSRITPSVKLRCAPRSSTWL